MKKLTVYRALNTFMNQLNSDKAMLELHRDRSCSFGDSDAQLNAINTMLSQGYLVPAATVVCNDLDQAFTLTNSISRSWLENDAVTVLENTDCFFSSSSVGDVFQDEDGTFFMVDSFGFKTLRKNEKGVLCPA